jgi:hypothetical protein
MDLVMDLEGGTSLNKIRGIFYSATTANLTMDYSVKVIEDDVVDSLPSCSQILLIVSSSSLLMGRSRPVVHIFSSTTKTRSNRKLYDLTPSSTLSTVVKVSL